jgi:DNA polymerase III epsilon subunit-like protein
MKKRKSVILVRLFPSWGVFDIQPSKRILFLDTETTGFPRKDWQVCPIEIVEIGWIVTDSVGTRLDEFFTLVKPVGKIPWYSYKVHGITTRHAKRNGKEIKDVLKKLVAAVSTVDLIIGHNIAFDMRVINNQLQKNRMSVIDKKTKCTWKMSKKKLGDWYFDLFGETFTGHRVKKDAEALVRCYFCWLTLVGEAN